MFSLLLRYRDPLLVGALLLAPLISFLSSGGRGREPNLADRAVLAVSAPVQGALTWAITGTMSAVDGYLALRGAHTEAQECQAQLAETSAELNALKEAKAENQRLKQLLNYVESTPEQEVLARVVGVNPSAQFQSMRLNRGETDGVHVGMAVLTTVLSPEGVPQGAVIGQVVRAVGGSADVMLITDPSSRLGVLNQRTRVRGTATGLGDGERLSLDFVRKEDDVQDKDTILTAGTDGVFPKGLLVGRVEGVSRPVTGMFLGGRVLPVVELHRVEEVLVVPASTTAAAAAMTREGTK